MASPAVILDLIDAFRRSKVLFVAESLGVFEKLSEGPASLATLASQLQVSLDGLERLLDGCVGLTLLTKSNGLYANTAAAEKYLLNASPDTMCGYIRYSETA